MSKRFPLERWTLPDVVAPSDSICFRVPVPNDKFHIAAFMGAIYALTWSKNWAEDADHTAADVSRVWTEIFDNLEPCEMVSIRLKPTDFCMVQLSTDGGSTWADVADLSACAHAAAVDEIQDAIDRGDLSGGGQQPGQGSGTPGVCYEYDITLHGSDRWLAPVAVEGNDIVTVSAEHGAWWHGDVAHLNWHCPDGVYFGLGNCFGSGYTDAADPVPSLLKMRLIGNAPEDSTTPYFDMYDTAYEIPAGVAEGDFYLQANDDALADNQGSINLHVQICKSLWTHVFDFAISDYGFVVDNATYTFTYTAGVGFVTTSTEPGADIKKSVPASTRIIEVRMEADCSNVSGGDSTMGVHCPAGGPYDFSSSTPPAVGNNISAGIGSSVNPANFRITLIPGHTGQGTITKCTVRGTGLDPF